jgi:hypothetical protein
MTDLERVRNAEKHLRSATRLLVEVSHPAVRDVLQQVVEARAALAFVLTMLHVEGRAQGEG